jgi:hypothetical protein
VFGRVDPGTWQAKHYAPAARPDRVPGAAVADGKARPAAAEVHAQAGNEADAPIEAEAIVAALFVVARAHLIQSFSFGKRSAYVETVFPLSSSIQMSSIPSLILLRAQSSAAGLVSKMGLSATSDRESGRH